MSEENVPEEGIAPEEATAPKEATTTIPSAGKQLMVMGIIVVGITIVLGGGVWLSMFLK
jgi:hypothetical protein|tara:strand:- start:5792 stop:5968 length:177 start_codon:yes stop_codon:yes gene_type:complete